jgi:hypothetical protein
VPAAAGSHSPTLLSAAIGQDNVFFTSHSAEPAPALSGRPVAPPGVLHIERKRFLWDERLYERVSLVNYSRDEVIIRLTFEFDADFRDMFEVRGARGQARAGMPPESTAGRPLPLRRPGRRPAHAASSPSPIRRAG